MDRTEGKTTPRLIAMAVSLLGSGEAVQAELKCSATEFREYCSGDKEVPWPQLDRLISMIIREQGLIIAKNREFLAQARAKAHK